MKFFFIFFILFNFGLIKSCEDGEIKADQELEKSFSQNSKNLCSDYETQILTKPKLQKIINKQESINNPWDYALYNAINDILLTSVEFVIYKGASVNFKHQIVVYCENEQKFIFLNTSPLTFACEKYANAVQNNEKAITRGLLPIIKYLLHKKSDINFIDEVTGLSFNDYARQYKKLGSIIKH